VSSSRRSARLLLNQCHAGRFRRADIERHRHRAAGTRGRALDQAVRAAITLFMSAIDTRFFALPNMPFSSVTECVAATTSNRPGSTCRLGGRWLES